MWGPAAHVHYCMFTFIMANKKPYFVHVIYIFKLDVILDYVVKKL